MPEDLGTKGQAGSIVVRLPRFCHYSRCAVDPFQFGGVNAVAPDFQRRSFCCGKFQRVAIGDIRDDPFLPFTKRRRIE